MSCFRNGSRRSIDAKSEKILNEGSRADTLFTTHAHSPLHRKCLQPAAISLLQTHDTLATQRRAYMQLDLDDIQSSGENTQGDRSAGNRKLPQRRGDLSGKNARNTGSMIFRDNAGLSHPAEFCSQHAAPDSVTKAIGKLISLRTLGLRGEQLREINRQRAPLSSPSRCTYHRPAAAISSSRPRCLTIICSRSEGS